MKEKKITVQEMLEMRNRHFEAQREKPRRYSWYFEWQLVKDMHIRQYKVKFIRFSILFFRYIYLFFLLSISFHHSFLCVLFVWSAFLPIRFTGWCWFFLFLLEQTSACAHWRNIDFGVGQKNVCTAKKFTVLGVLCMFWC